MKSNIEIAKDLAQKIAYLNRLVFNNGVAVHVIPAGNKEWRDESGIALYNTKDDFYVVVTDNINKLTITTEAGLFGTAAHEVRHRFQHKNPSFILPQDFLTNEGFIANDAIARIIHLNKNIPNIDLKLEIDSMVIEELVRKTCFGLSLEEILNEIKIKDIFSILICNKDNFHEIYLKAHYSP